MFENFCSTQLRRRKSTGRDSRCFGKMSSYFDEFDNKHTCTILTSFFAICSAFSKTNERKIEASSSQTQCPVFKRLAPESY